MSNQIVISSGAKVRSLEGVLTGTAGIVSSVPLGGANGVATLDSSGKVPLSQLPASVITYLGTWNAATNTPTLVNGTGDDGDLYICNVAGTVDFGAGPITFSVGDWVIYGSGTWQKSAGQNGTVTSVAVTESGDALTITGSPITTAGTINIGFAGDSTQYINGAGNLVTFPTIITEAQNLITEVYNETGATLTKGTVVYINGGHGNLPTVTKALATSDATSAQTYGVVQADISNNNNGHVVVIGRLEGLDTQAYTNGTQLYLSSTTAGEWTSTKQYAPAHLVYVGIVTRSHPTQGVVEIKIQNGYELDELHNVSAQTPNNGDILQYISSTSLWTSVAGSTSNIAEGSNLYFTNARARSAISLTTNNATGAATYNSTTGVLNIPDYSAAGYVPYVGATASLNLGTNAVTAFGVNIYGSPANDIGGAINIRKYSSAWSLGSGDNISLYATTGNALVMQTGSRFAYLDFNSVSTSTPRTYTFPDATGTLALTSDIPSLTNYVTLNGAQTITGIKTFTNEQLFGNGITLTGGYITYTSGSYNLTLNTNILTANRNVFLQDGSGTLAFTSDIPSLSGYVPYTGATGAVNLGAYDLTVQGITFGLGAIGQATNLAIGVQALASNTSTSGGTTAIGYQTLTANTTGYQNTGVGYAALVSNTSGLNNTALGASALSTVTTGRDNIGIGLSAGQGITTGSYNTIIGKATGLSSSLSNNIILADGQGNIRYQWNGTTNSFTGAATFSSSVTANGDLTISATQPNSYLTYTDATSYARMLFYESSTYKGVIQFMGSSFVTTSRRNALEIINGTTGDIAMGSGDTRTFYIKNGGNVGIGTSSPVSKLSIGGDGYADRAITAIASGGDFAATIQQNSTGAGLQVYSNNTNWGNDAFKVQSNGGTQFNIKSNGNVLVGTSTDSGMKFQVQGEIYTKGDGAILNIQARDLSMYYGFFASNNSSLNFWNSTSGVTGYFTRTTGIYVATSDYNKKKDFEESTLGINAILGLKPTLYRMKNDIDNSKKHLGFIAQEVKEFIPQAYHENNVDGSEEIFIGLDYNPIVATLVKAVQEQQAQIEELKKLINK